LDSSLPVTSVLLLLTLVLVPASLPALAALAGHASCATSRVSVATRELFCRFSVALVPLGVAMWAAHFLFHLSAGWGSARTVIQRAANDNGWHLLNLASSELSSHLLGVDAMRVLQTVLLDAGLLLALYLVWRISLVYASRGRDALRLFLPWAVLATVLYASGVWIVLQPMQMRGVPNAASTI
jgi:hypothetical protein